MGKRKLILLGAASVSVIVVGVVVAVMLHVTAVIYNEGKANNTGPYAIILLIAGEKYWIFAIVLGIFPGIIGLVAALVQNKWMYLTTLIITAISISIIQIYLGIINEVLWNIIIGQGYISEYCTDAGDKCQCRDYTYKTDEPSLFKTCAHFKKFSAVLTALLVFITLTWAAQTSELVLAYLNCSCNKATARVVSMPSQQSMLEHRPYIEPQA